MAKDDAKALGKKLRGRARAIEPNVWRIMVVMANAMGASVIRSTPVDTGRARSNWRVGIGQAPGKVIAPYSPGHKLGIGETANADAAIAKIKSTLANPRRKPHNIYLKNNVHYIGKLNRGHSSQAPSQYVQKAVRAGIMSLHGTKICLISGGGLGV